MTKIVYLDNNSTTRTDDKAIEAMLPYLNTYYANPSSIHSFGGEVAHALDKAREQMKAFLGANSTKEIFFTASGTESANMAIRGVLNANKNKKHIITSKIEHPCVLNLYKNLEKEGYNVTYLSVNNKGQLDFAELEAAVNENTALVSCMMANNETGIIFPIEKIAETVKRINPKTKIFTDAVQAAGKIPLNLENSQIDLLSVSGHKFHAPKGIGALYVKSGVLFTPLIIGGHQERGKRAGTENVSGIIAMGEAAELAMNNMEYELSEVKRLRDKLEKGILENIPNARLNSISNNRVPNTTNIAFEYVEGELILLHLSDLGICASSGSACTSGSLEPSHVLKAMGVPFTALHGSIRFSLSRYTTEEEIDYTIEKLTKVIAKLSAISPYQKELNELKAKHQKG